MPSDPTDDAPQPLVPAKKKSLWGKAKETLSEVPNHASKVAALGTAGAARTAELGKQTIGAASDVTRGALETGKQAYARSKLEYAGQYFRRL